MPRTLVRSIAVAGCLLALAAMAPAGARAEDAAKPAEAAAPAEEAGDCPGRAAGGCCSECQDKAVQGSGGNEKAKAVEAAAGGCPCQRKRKAREAGAAGS